MPTRPGFDLVPLRKETKARLARLKGGRSFDALLQDLLASAGDLDARPVPSKARDPEEQLALADLAARRWKALVAQGRIEERGPRLLVYWTRKDAPRRRLDVRWTGERGLPP